MNLDYIKFDLDFLIFLAVELLIIVTFILLIRRSRYNGGFFDRRLRIRRIDDRRSFTYDVMNEMRSDRRNGDRRAARRRASDQIAVSVNI